MNLADYRNLIDAVSYRRTSLLSAATSHEQRLEAMRLRNAVAELQAAGPRSPKLADLEKARRVLEAARVLLVKKQEEFNRADANLQEMAFRGPSIY